jgi:hypothetical protein
VVAELVAGRQALPPPARCAVPRLPPAAARPARALRVVHYRTDNVPAGPLLSNQRWAATGEPSRIRFTRAPARGPPHSAATSAEAASCRRHD